MKNELAALQNQVEALDGRVDGAITILLDQSDSLKAIDKTLIVNTEQLKEHMRRTELIERELKPVVKHVEQMRGAGKLIALLSLIGGIVAAYAALR